MLTTAHSRLPNQLESIEAETERLGFDMPSMRETGALLRTLAAAKPGGKLLELGTGTGLSAAWLLDGMNASARLVTVDNDPDIVAVAQRFLGDDPRLTITVADGDTWLREAQDSVDLIFADAMPGKYESFDTAWGLLAAGGVYVIDDMVPQPNWPADHDQRVAQLLADLDGRPDCHVVRLDWASGIVIAVKREA